MLVFIGSVALNRFRETPMPTKDVDAIADYDTAARFLKLEGCTSVYPINEGKTLFGRNGNTIFEIEIAWPDTTAESFLQLFGQHRTEFLYSMYDGEEAFLTSYASLDMLYTLKMSHRYRRNSPHFLKTMRDIHEMRQMGAQIPEAYRDWYRLRQKETYSYKLPNLNVSKSEFFGDLYQYDHDSLHEAVKIYDAPAYTYYSDGEVWSSKEKFYESCSEDIRLAGVVEEASVLALERSLIPHPDAKTEDEAFQFALKKVCTSITSGWFREYAWEHYDQALELYKIRVHGGNSLGRLFWLGKVDGVIKESPEWQSQK
jgi:hypothetical protein